MKIYFKEGKGRRHMIPAPLWLVKAALGMGGVGMSIARKHVPEDQLIYLENIDLRELRKGFDILRQYKGLILLDVRTKDGTEVKIIV